MKEGDGRKERGRGRRREKSEKEARGGRRKFAVDCSDENVIHNT